MRFFTSLLCIITLIGCKQAPPSQTAKVTLALNWVPEPEFGGFYAIKKDTLQKYDLDLEIQPSSAGAPIVQRVAAGEVQFGIVSADELVIARARNQDLVAIFTVYQTCPQGIMTHAARGFKTLDDVFKNSGTLAMEPGLPYTKFLEKKYAPAKVNVVPYTGGITQFLTDTNYSQQCFIFSEPLTAKAKGSDPQTFLIADSGYNPYTGVVVCRGDFAKNNARKVEGMIAACREGWRAYLDDPKPANAVMGQLNKTMDAQTFADAAKAQATLIDAPQLGAMTADRWDTLAKQLIDLKVIEHAPAGKECMIQP
jgi:NitT/TauT family transport system substrate-binding protein